MAERPNRAVTQAAPTPQPGGGRGTVAATPLGGLEALRPAMAAAQAAADGALALNNKAKQTTLLLFCGQGNA